MVTEKVLKWGIVGCGLISHDFVKAMKNCEHPNKVVAVGEDNIAGAENFKNKLGLGDDVRAYGVYDEFFNDENIDIVYIGIVNFLHYSMVMTALDNGKHVLCEKPLGMTVRQVNNMVAKAKEKNLFLMEACFSRFFPIWKSLRQHLEDGTMGEATSVHANMANHSYTDMPNRFRLRPGVTVLDTGAIPLMDFGLYTLMIALFVFKDEKPERVSVVGTKNEQGVDVWGNITLEFSKGRKAALFYSHADIFPNNAYIGCKKGHIVIPEFRSPDEMTLIHGRTSSSSHEEGKKEVVHLDYADGDHTYNFLGSAGLRYETDHVYERIRDGHIESDNVIWKFSQTIAEILEEVRKQLGVVLPQDKE